MRTPQPAHERAGLTGQDEREQGRTLEKPGRSVVREPEGGQALFFPVVSVFIEKKIAS